LARNLKNAFVPDAAPRKASMTADAIQLLERLRTLPQLGAATVGRTLGVSLQHLEETRYVATHRAKITLAPFETVDVREPLPGAGAPARVILFPAPAALPLAAVAAWFGDGAPYHMDVGARPYATVRHELDGRALYVTFAVDSRLVRAVTFEALGVAKRPI
jgi:hypothetical protein